MRPIVITPPDYFRFEVAWINKLIQSGCDVIHIRKPDWSQGAMTLYLEQFRKKILRHFVLHHHHDLSEEFPVRGIHLTFRDMNPPMLTRTMTISRSMHTMEEVIYQSSKYDYVFFSPVFESISKEDQPMYTEEEMIEMNMKRPQDATIIALGGIDKSKLKKVERLGFNGVALMGDLWGNYADDPAVRYAEYLE